ncbi:MAG: hypothetical protein KatS3mg038_0796 [Candidatus Kapaibacterium sp.]|nr:MAG: hypothetical protein KatS3mg038_0796 [Candidatus Kapabacteria bacterium]
MNDPVVLKYSNEVLRPLAVDLVKLHQRVEQAIQLAKSWGILQKVAADTTFSDVLEDGAPQDGRPPITAGGLGLFVQNMEQFLSHLKQQDPTTGLTFIDGVYSVAPFVPRE